MELSCSTRVDSDLALSLLLKKSGGAKSALLNISRSKVYLKVHIQQALNRGGLETVLGGSDDQLLPPYPFSPSPCLDAAGWQYRGDRVKRVLLVQ